jgi:hypothetical protein
LPFLVLCFRYFEFPACGKMVKKKTTTNCPFFILISCFNLLCQSPIMLLLLCVCVCVSGIETDLSATSDTFSLTIPEAGYPPFPPHCVHIYTHTYKKVIIVTQFCFFCLFFSVSLKQIKILFAAAVVSVCYWRVSVRIFAPAKKKNHSNICQSVFFKTERKLKQKQTPFWVSVYHFSRTPPLFFFAGTARKLHIWRQKRGGSSVFLAVEESRKYDTITFFVFLYPL